MDKSGSKYVSPDKVKEAATALIAYHKSKEDAKEVLFGEPLKIQLQLSVWQIMGKKSKTYQIKLPHTPHAGDIAVCLFVKDEADMDTETCQRHYKDKLRSMGITSVNEVIPLKMLKKEYIPFEARRRLARSYNLFLADSRIFRLLHSSLGKEFYKRNRYPFTVNLEKKDLKSELDSAVNSSYFIMTHRGSCSMMTVANTAMPVTQVSKNIMAAINNLANVVPQGWQNVKSVFVRSEKSVSLPIYTSLVHKEWTPSAKAGEEIDNSDIKKLKKQLAFEAQTVKEVPMDDLEDDDDDEGDSKATKSKVLKKRKSSSTESKTPVKSLKRSKQDSISKEKKTGSRLNTPKIGGKKKK